MTQTRTATTKADEKNPDLFVIVANHRDGRQEVTVLSEERAEAEYRTLTSKYVHDDESSGGGSYELPEKNVKVFKLAATPHTF